MLREAGLSFIERDNDTDLCVGWVKGADRMFPCPILGIIRSKIVMVQPSTLYDLTEQY